MYVIRLWNRALLSMAVGLGSCPRFGLAMCWSAAKAAKAAKAAAPHWSSAKGGVLVVCKGGGDVLVVCKGGVLVVCKGDALVVGKGGVLVVCCGLRTSNECLPRSNFVSTISAAKAEYAIRAPR